MERNKYETNKEGQEQIECTKLVEFNEKELHNPVKR